MRPKPMTVNSDKHVKRFLLKTALVLLQGPSLRLFGKGLTIKKAERGEPNEKF